MWLIEALKTICNTFIRKINKTEPEGKKEVTEKQNPPEPIAETNKKAETDDLERQIRRYRAFAYNHRKKRIRKKYLKKLLAISSIDRFIYMVNSKGITLRLTRRKDYVVGVDYSTRKDFSPGDIGGGRTDHGDSRMKGGIR